MVMAMTSIEMSSSRDRPTRRSTRSATSEPTRLPMPIVVMSTPKPTSSRPIGPGATTYRTMIPKAAELARLAPPTMRAMVRSTRCPRR